jgi:hypothetical protein
VSTRVGYTGGTNANATYRNHPGHAEAIEIVYDPARTTYRDLLEFFFQIHDPSTVNRQGNDVGTSYRSAIFYVDDEQKRIAEDTIADVDASKLWPGVTEVTPGRSGRPSRSQAPPSATPGYLPLPAGRTEAAAGRHVVNGTGCDYPQMAAGCGRSGAPRGRATSTVRWSSTPSRRDTWEVLYYPQYYVPVKDSARSTSSTRTTPPAAVRHRAASRCVNGDGGRGRPRLRRRPASLCGRALRVGRRGVVRGGRADRRRPRNPNAGRRAARAARAVEATV